MTDRDYCHFHLSIRGRRLKMARARARGERCCVELPPLEDLYAVQVGIQHVLDALLRGQLDRHLGGVVLYGLQQAASNVRLPQEAGRIPPFQRRRARPRGPASRKTMACPRDSMWTLRRTRPSRHR